MQLFNRPIGAVLSNIRRLILLLAALVLSCLALNFDVVAAPQPQADKIGTALYGSAQSCQGKAMWKDGYGLTNGTMGCAAAVCGVIKTAGYPLARSASVSIMRKQLLTCKFKCHEFAVKDNSADDIDDGKLLSMARPGDIVVAFMANPNQANSGPNAHCGIMGKDLIIYTNDWNDGIWKGLDIHLMFDNYKYVHLLRF